MSAAVQNLYQAKMGLAKINVSNPNLNGTGTIVNLITGTTNGTIVKAVIIKALVSTSEGMVRLFSTISGSSTLLREIYVPPTPKSSRDVSFSAILPLNYNLKLGETLSASTETDDVFNVIVEAFDQVFTTSGSFLGTTVEYIPNTGKGVVNTANSNLDGSGSLVQIFTAAAAADGCALNSILIKAQQDTTPGMIRLYIQDAASGSKFLFCEVYVPYVTRNGHIPSFVHYALSGGTLCIPKSYKIWASTEQSESFGIVANGADWTNV